MPVEPGVILGGRYRIVKYLAQGGMGAVYRGWDLRLSVPVAVKELIPLPGQDEEILVKLTEQFRQEATILASLTHPNLEQALVPERAVQTLPKKRFRWLPLILGTGSVSG